MAVPVTPLTPSTFGNFSTSNISIDLEDGGTPADRGHEEEDSRFGL